MEAITRIAGETTIEMEAQAAVEVTTATSNLEATTLTTAKDPTARVVVEAMVATPSPRYYVKNLI